jgi:hypothetical protein
VKDQGEGRERRGEGRRFFAKIDPENESATHHYLLRRNGKWLL